MPAKKAAAAPDQIIFDAADVALLFQDEPQQPEEQPKQEEEKNPNAGKQIVVTHRKGLRQLTRKAASENALEKQMDWHFEPGDSYHCFSFGDVDSFSFFKHILKQQRIKYAAISTWCMAGEDVLDLCEWHRRGMVGRIDFFVGQIFQGSYPEVYAMARDFCRECGGRLVIFRNHSKVMAIHGEKFDALIESSANINTNPRSENTVVTVDRDLVRDYVKLFSEIRSFARNFDDVQPYTVEDFDNA